MRRRAERILAGGAAIAHLFMFAQGCATSRLPAPEMTSNWVVRQGQAVWTPPRAKDGIAGELLVATNSTGDFVVEFSKAPFTIATAQRQGARWQVAFPAEKKGYGGRGDGPSQIIWLKLAPALLGHSDGWSFSTNANGWRMERKREALEGFLAP
jgi:hypothetical protein